jgi:beta-mannosidase
MQIDRLILFFLLICAAACNESTSDIDYLYLNDDWQFSLKNDAVWMPGTVPGSVQGDLMMLNKIPHPFEQNNEDSIQWISEMNWNYKKHFSVSKEILRKKKHVLTFKGIDTYASVYLNDSLILLANNAFRSWEIDISNFLLAENELLVQFSSPDSIEKAETEKLDYELPEAPRVFTRKPQFQYGWDWSPTLKTIGLWRDVTLTSYNIARSTDVFLQTKSISDTLAEITAQLTIETPEFNEITVKITNENLNESIYSTFQISPDQSIYKIPFSIKNPILWWTHNLGGPFMYDIKIELTQDRKRLETYKKKLGIRSIELITNKDSLGESFYFKLNGLPVYMKGANYIPQEILRASLRQEDQVQLIDDVVAANMNMLRVWGGGVYENNSFYQLCDAKGILVWQDFMFACAMYPGDAAFLENIKQEAIQNVKRLRQHPSIALWCGNNENSEGWNRWGWQDGKTESQKQEIWSNYDAVFNNILPKIVDSLSPSVDYWESSPKYGRGDERYQLEGDAHDWWVWHDDYPFEHYETNVPRFMSEFGFQSFPSQEIIHYFTGQDSINLSHSSFATHQKHKRGFQIIKEYMSRDFPVPTKDEDYIYVSQLLQAYGISKGIHAQRRAKPYNMGSLFWQLNDCWPAVSWSSIDYFGNWKALHYKAKKAFENVLISSYEKDGILKVYLVNDTFSEIKNNLIINHLDFFGNVLSVNSIPVISHSNSSAIVYEFPINKLEFPLKNSVLKLNFGEAEFLHYFVKPKNLMLQQGEITTEIIQNETGFSVVLRSETLQKDVFLANNSKGKWEDNFFDLLPNKSKTVRFFTENKNPPIISIKTLNQLILK